MTVPVPVALPSSTGWQVVDRIDQVFTSTPAGADGLATITLPQLDTATRWELTHMVAACSSSTATVMRLYFDSVSAAGFRDGTDDGNFDVADWARGLFIPEGRQVVVQWSGCSAGAVATLTLQADVSKRTS